MKKICRTLIMVSMALNLSACVFIPEKITLDPTLSAPTSLVGKGKKVAIYVVDKRPEKSLGGRASYLGGMANIGLASNPTEVIGETITKGLKNNGFVPVSYNPKIGEGKKLFISILDIDYDEITNPWDLEIVVSNTIKVTASDHYKTYEKTYRKQHIYTTLIAPTTSEDQQYINKTFSATLNEILTDKALLTFLAK